MQAAEVQDDLKTVKHGDDSNAWARFYFNKVHNKHFIKINFAGDNKSEWDMPATEEHKMRFRKQWELYEQKLSQFGDDAMIDELEFLNDNQIEKFRQFNVHTVKQLAGLTDQQMDNMGMGMREVVAKAQNWLINESEDNEKQKLKLAIRQRDDKIAELEAAHKTISEEMAEMREQMSEIRSAPRGNVPDEPPPQGDSKVRPTIGGF